MQMPNTFSQAVSLNLPIIGQLVLSTDAMLGSPVLGTLAKKDPLPGSFQPAFMGGVSSCRSWLQTPKVVNQGTDPKP